MSILKGRRNYLSFDGVNDYVDFGDNSDFDFGTNTFEIQIDFKINEQKIQRLVSKRVEGSETGFPQYYLTLNDNGGITFVTYSDLSSSTISSPDNIVILNKRYNLIAKRLSNGYMELVLDGNVVASNTLPVRNVTNNGSMWFGADNRDNNQFLNGNIYNVKFYENNTLISQYDFTEGTGTTLNDSVGNNDGTIVGATWGEEGEPLSAIYKGSPSYALSFDGVNNYVDLGNNLYNFNAITYEFYMNIKGFNNSFPRIISKSDLDFEISSSNNEFVFRFNSNTINIGSIDLNVMTHYAFTYDLSTLKFYKNGVLEETLSFNNSPVSNVEFYYLFNRGDFARGNYADIKDFRIWNDVRTEQEINDNKDIKLNGNENNLVLYYDFTEGSGTTLTDKVGNNNGTINGATWSSPLNEIQRVYKGDDIVYSKYIVATGGSTLTYEENGKFYKTHTFTSSGNFIVNGLGIENNKLDYLIIGGGGGARTNYSGGGGAGGYRTTLGTSGGNSISENKIDAIKQNYTILVGSGGTSGANGGNSSFYNLVSTGGGAGGGSFSGRDGQDGGSGGGGAEVGGLNGNGITGQGYNGGDGNSSYGGAGGGGGASQTGQNAPSQCGGKGGDGLVNTIRSGQPETRAGGGGGWGNNSSCGLGGTGGGGNGYVGTSSSNTRGSDGAQNTGGGSGGNSQSGTVRLNGGSGIVIIRYEVGGL